MVVDNIIDISKNELVLYNPIYIFTTEIQTVEDRFNASISAEFYQVNGIWYRNTFAYTPYLTNRIE
ncbi:hypothetical protein [Sulfurimonas sp.]|uniref:hypothetical protein n=1 Tax=Sulfurimonas sp. TaxID=2022749 RepID=UPI0025CD1218|nr:hypothetical protein [Sulfurimonas sp.]